MSYRKLKDILKQTMDEGLNKNQYNKILDGLNLGVEIEIITPDSYRGYSEEDTDIHMELDFNDNFRNLNNCIEDTNRSIENLDEYVMELIPAFKNVYLTEIESPQENYTGYVSTIYRDVSRELGRIQDQVKVRYDSLHEEIISYVMSDRGKSIVEEFINSEENTDGITLEGYWAKFKELTEDIEYQLNEMENNIKSAEESAKDTINNIEIESEFSNSEVDLYSVKSDIKVSGKDINQASINNLQLEVVTDSSLTDGGVEIVTPPLKYQDFIELIPEFAQDLKDEGYYSDETCGYHIGISHDSINLHSLMSQTYNKYLDKGYSAFTAFLVATQQGYESTGRHNDRERGISNKYSQSLISFIHDEFNKRSEYINLENLTLQDLLYGGDYKTQLKNLVDQFIKDKYVNVNLKHGTHIELRTLGGEEGFDVLRDEGRLKQFLYDAISQVFGGIRDLDTQEVTKLVRSVMRTSLNKPTEDSITRIKNKIRQSREQ